MLPTLASGSGWLCILVRHHISHEVRKVLDEAGEILEDEASHHSKEEDGSGRDYPTGLQPFAEEAQHTESGFSDNSYAEPVCCP